MISIRIRGGLGNQLFQYATAYAVARDKNERLGLEITSYQTRPWPRYELKKIHIKPDTVIAPKFGSDIVHRAIINKIRKRLNIGVFTVRYAETGSVTEYHSEINSIGKNTYLNGFFQNEKYFKKHREDLLEQIRPVSPLESQSQHWIKMMRQCDSVAIHVRRGDYVQIGCGIGMDYYDHAIALIGEKVEKPKFFVFSDDIEYCKEYFAKYENTEFEFVSDIPESDDKDINEFFIMSSCKHQIIANSSFSWWAAWINQNKDKKVIAPVVGMWGESFYPEEWTTIKIGE